MKYFEMFTGIGGFSKGIEQAYGHGNKYESTQPEPSNGESGRKRVTNGGRADGIFCGSLDSSYHKGPDGKRTMIGTLRTHKDGEGFREMQSNVSPSLNARARQDGSQQPVIAIPVLTPDRPTKRQNGRRMKDDGEASFTVTAADRHGVMVYSDRLSETDTAGTLKSRHDSGREVNHAQTGIVSDQRIRRLTPRECNRLQGFPDNWTDFGINEKGETYAISDTGKYQCAGNAVTVNVTEAIVTRMIEKGCLG